MMETAEFSNRLSGSRLPSRSREQDTTTPSDGEVDLVKETWFDEALEIGNRPPARHVISDLSLQQRHANTVPEAPYSTPRSSRLQIVLDSTPNSASRPQQPPFYSEEDDNPTSPGIGLKSKDKTERMARATAKPKSVHQSGSSPQHQEETVKRKRGRPKGWKPGTSYSGRPLTPAETLERAERNKRKTSPSHGIKKRRGPRPKQAPPTPKQIFDSLRPEFIPFSCEWRGCKAELQNMATLRRHVIVVHRRSQICRWGKCATKVPPVFLETEGSFDNHMEDYHLVPYEWHMGDGYKNTLTAPRDDSETIAPYLLDKDGNQVTPSIRDQEEEDLETYQKNRKRLRDLLIQRDANAPSKEEYSIQSD